MSEKRLLNDGWEFVKTPIDTPYSDDLKFERVDIPHDWLIYDTKNLYETSRGWYRKHYNHTPDGKNTAIRFEGVYMDSRVYVNGKLAGEWKYGYSTFEFDITELLREGDNLISVSVDYRNPNSRWYSGAGIFRPVYLKRYEKTHIVSDGVYISAMASGVADISVEIERSEGTPVQGLTVSMAIMDGDRVVACEEHDVCAVDKRFIADTVRREGCSYAVNSLTLFAENVHLWDVDDPYLYTCAVKLMRDGQIIDTESVRFGFRDIQFTTDEGFFLNGRHLKIHGACEHHDLGALGAASNRAATFRKARALKSMGINAIRTSHNMPSVEWMEAADELGLLVMSEAFDMWEMPKNEYDYARFFKDWVDRDVASWVRRDRNHPSIIGWSVGNEIYDAHAGERGQEIISLLLYLVNLHDPRGNGYVTHGSNFLEWENAQKCTDIVKLAGYNYGERLYDEHHEKHPDWMIYGSETSSVVQSRGIYHFPYSQAVLVDDDEQCSSLGNSTMGWAAKSTEMAIIPDRDRDYCAGQFIWTGHDYIGEPTPYSTKNSYFGQIDTAGFKKDSYYIFKAEWTDYKKDPFVHILPYWDFSEGQDIDVRVISNAPRVELFKDGVSVGAMDIDHAHGTTLSLNVTLPYRMGELLAKAYNENGEVIATDVKRSFGDVTGLKLTPDKTELMADGSDMVFLEISAVDENGTEVANANNRVTVAVEGAGRLVGLDNGDSTDYEQYKGVSRRLFSGKLLAMIAAKREPGDITVSVKSPGLRDYTVTLHALPAASEGVSAVMECAPNTAGDIDEAGDIPVRKIEFVTDGTTFTPECDTKTIHFNIRPAGTTYSSQLTFKVTTVLGIATNLAEIVSVNDDSVTVHCKGDGEFYLRATCANGTDKQQVLTQLKLTGEGLGSASFDPYEFVVGGLFNVQRGGVSTGVQRGACFAKEGSFFGFTDVDFGMVGSDRVNLPVYHLGNDPVTFRIYDGIPGEGGEIIGDYSYWKPPIWATYQPEDFVLTRKLKGMHTLVFESDYSFQIAGFKFYKEAKESAVIAAVDALNIYGDSFSVDADAVTGIGNNVLLDFGEFDFGENAPSKIVITGKSALELNSIHVDFKGDVTVKKLCEFAGCEDYTAREFDLSGVKGRVNVTFTFLPGSNFDFRDFKFV
ncbi:MAG: DUF4982 domain-containing protein [Lachnospiraceae bacterium]|nr:DUF4982 domain-containing protein [Lachnospiraceae bacterium]